MTGRGWIVAGAVCGFLAVCAGAFGAHGLKKTLEPDMLAVFETGSRYAMYHALALVGTGLLALHQPSKPASVAGWGFLSGVVIFSGSLWILALSGLRWLGMITPIGGLAFLVGWVALGLAARRPTQRPETTT